MMGGVGGVSGYKTVSPPPPPPDLSLYLYIAICTLRYSRETYTPEQTIEQNSSSYPGQLTRAGVVSFIMEKV